MFHPSHSSFGLTLCIGKLRIYRSIYFKKRQPDSDSPVVEESLSGVIALRRLLEWMK
jgi:hypothetical protein